MLSDYIIDLIRSNIEYTTEVNLSTNMTRVNEMLLEHVIDDICNIIILYAYLSSEHDLDINVKCKMITKTNMIDIGIMLKIYDYKFYLRVETDLLDNHYFYVIQTGENTYKYEVDESYTTILKEPKEAPILPILLKSDNNLKYIFESGAITFEHISNTLWSVYRTSSLGFYTISDPPAIFCSTCGHRWISFGKNNRKKTKKEVYKMLKNHLQKNSFYIVSQSYPGSIYTCTKPFIAEYNTKDKYVRKINLTTLMTESQYIYICKQMKDVIEKLKKIIWNEF